MNYECQFRGFDKIIVEIQLKGDGIQIEGVYK